MSTCHVPNSCKTKHCCRTSLRSCRLCQAPVEKDEENHTMIEHIISYSEEPTVEELENIVKVDGNDKNHVLCKVTCSLSLIFIRYSYFLLRYIQNHQTYRCTDSISGTNGMSRLSLAHAYDSITLTLCKFDYSDSIGTLFGKGSEQNKGEAYVSAD